MSSHIVSQEGRNALNPWNLLSDVSEKASSVPSVVVEQTVIKPIKNSTSRVKQRHISVCSMAMEARARVTESHRNVGSLWLLIENSTPVKSVLQVLAGRDKKVFIQENPHVWLGLYECVIGEFLSVHRYLIHVEVPFQDPFLKVIRSLGTLGYLFDRLFDRGHAHSPLMFPEIDSRNRSGRASCGRC